MRVEGGWLSQPAHHHVLMETSWLERGLRFFTFGSHAVRGPAGVLWSLPQSPALPVAGLPGHPARCPSSSNRHASRAHEEKSNYYMHLEACCRRPKRDVMRYIVQLRYIVSPVNQGTAIAVVQEGIGIHFFWHVQGAGHAAKRMGGEQANRPVTADAVMRAQKRSFLEVGAGEEIFSGQSGFGEIAG